MKLNQKKLELIQYGLKPSLVTNLTESQTNNLFDRIVESKKENKEAVTKTSTTTTYDPKNDTDRKAMQDTMAKKGVPVSVDPATQKVTVVTQEGEMSEEEDEEMNWLMKNSTQQPTQKGPSTDDGFDSYPDGTNEDVNEKFESKQQQKYFYAKCGDGKTKEQKKWCKMADEFAQKTNFKKLPEKKLETKESGLTNFNKKVVSAFSGGINKNLKNMPLNPTFGESEIEKKIMNIVEKHITPKMTKKDLLSIVKGDNPSTPVKPTTKPTTKPNKPGTPYQPKPRTPYQPKPGVKPSPKANKQIPNWLTFNKIGIKLK